MSDDQSAPSGEFEREPVPESALLGFKSFIGMYAGEHCAGTELMIGPLFVAAGVSAYDLVVGLFLGNLLAMLSWVLLTAPIATQARLTLYYQLEKICGRKLVTLYNLANGIMFCFLAGAMITVSATAVGVWFNIPMPGLNDIYPNSAGWVISVLAVGTVISIVAALGYQTVSRFANIAAPWMVLVFFVFGLVSIKQFISATDTEINSLGDLWQLAETTIWTGGEPLPGQIKFTFWHVTFFAWFCNMAMHIGMADLSVLRYARKSWYGVASAAGMYVGHFMAWIAAASLFAYLLHSTHPTDYMKDLLINHSQGEYTQEDLVYAPLSAELLRKAMTIEDQLFQEGKIKEKQIESPAPLPGELAYGVCGIAGLICVIIAGWTTANPTIYRAGLAFQAIMPNRSRFAVTLATGALATIAGLFPAIAMKLLGFVAIYGMILMPMGAIIFVDHYLLKRFGLIAYYAERSGSSFNWAAGLTWFLTMGACVALVQTAGVQIYFVSLPGWFIAAILYIVLSKLYQKSVDGSESPKPSLRRRLLQLISSLALAATIGPAVMFYYDMMPLETLKSNMFVATICWFVATALWMGRKDTKPTEAAPHDTP